MVDYFSEFMETQVLGVGAVQEGGGEGSWLMWDAPESLYILTYDL